MSSEKSKPITAEDILALKEQLKDYPKNGGPIQIMTLSHLPPRTIMVSEDLWEDIKKVITKPT